MRRNEEEQIAQLQQKCKTQRNKIKRLNEKVRKRNKKITALNNMIEDLKKSNKINNEEAQILKECAGPEDFLKRQIAKSRGLPVEKKYSEEVRKFALTLHFLSPKAYNFVRQTYNTCLPHARTLSKWYEHVNAEPGFTKEAFDTLKRKVGESENTVVCSLIFDEMAIRKDLIWDPISKKYYGRIDYGHNIDSDGVGEAKQSLVILLNCINGSWKLPIGYFYINSLSGEQKTVLIQTALKLCQDVGVKIVSITCDGPATNFSMFECLGINLIEDQNQTSFEHNGSRIHAFIDPCHAIKLVRNTFGDFKVFIDNCGRTIDFKYLEILLELQDQQGLHLATKISKAHILFQKQKMKVKLATQLFSNSVADALEYCRSKLKINEFEDSAGTINFINLMNDIFDVLNSHSIRPPGWKKAMCPENIGLVKALFDSATHYIASLRFLSGEVVIKSRRRTGFIGLMINMKSALDLYEYLVNDTQILKYIPVYKVSQDHIELFFSAIRARGGFNNNPNAVQFRAAYKKLLIRAEIRDGGVGNCVPLEQVNILTCSSKNPVESINELTEKQSLVEIDEDHSDLYESYVEYIGTDLDEYSESVVEYISGFVTRKLSRSLKCEKCVALLSGEKNVDSLIWLKTRGGLKYAAKDVQDITKRTEKLVKPLLRDKTKPENYYLYVFRFLTEFYNTHNIFCISNDPDHNANHRFLLIKSVIKVYLDIRFRYHGVKLNEKVSQRTFLNKLILFRNE